VTKVGGVTREFDATITEQHPDERVALMSTDGPDHGGVITFHRIADGKPRVTAQMEIDPEGFVETSPTSSACRIAASRLICGASRSSSRSAAARRIRGGVTSTARGTELISRKPGSI
jgi:hypothetical protein